MVLYATITAILALNGAVLLALTWLSRTQFGASHKLRDARNHKLEAARFRHVAIVNSVLSVSMIYACAYLFGPALFQSGAFHIGRSLLEGAAILLIYDFFYYLVHRYPFHEWRILRRVHAMHHVVRNPTAIDSLYMHPLENFLGLGLLWACTWAVARIGGPVSVYTFGWVLLVHSLLNVVVHAGLDLKGPGLGLVTYLGRRHNRHHVDMNGKNYASVTPIWDLVFGTEEP